MSEKSEIVFMQVRLLRLASEEWQMPIQKAEALGAYHIHIFCNFLACISLWTSIPRVL